MKDVDNTMNLECDQWEDLRKMERKCTFLVRIRKGYTRHIMKKEELENLILTGKNLDKIAEGDID